MDEDAKISERTRKRDNAKVTKMGYLDGVKEGQQSVLQDNFDTGIMRGLNFGFILGYRKAMSMYQHATDLDNEMHDPRKLNCQICLDVMTLQLKHERLDKNQQKKNTELVNEHPQ